MKSLIRNSYIKYCTVTELNKVCNIRLGSPDIFFWDFSTHNLLKEVTKHCILCDVHKITNYSSYILHVLTIDKK